MNKILSILILASSLFSITNKEVAIKSDKVTNGFISSRSNMTMTLINARGQQTIRKMKSFTLEGTNGNKSLMIFLTPADVKGTKMLTHEHISKDDDQWMYLPALKRVKRIASRNKSGSFMGSEFSYEDTANASWKKYTYENDLEVVILDGTKCYKGTRYPKDRNSGYTKQITWIDTNTLLVKKVEYFDRKKERLKTATFTEYKKISGIWRMGKIFMKNHQNSKSTILSWTKREIKVGLKAKDFTKRKLKR